EVGKEAGAVPRVAEPRLDDEREAQLAGGGAARLERGWRAGLRDAQARRGGDAQRRALVERLEEQRIRCAAGRDAGGLPRTALCIDEAARAFGERKHDAGAARAGPIARRGKRGGVVGGEAEAAAAEAGPAGERRGPAARDEHGIPRAAERARARERLRRLAVEDEDGALRLQRCGGWEIADPRGGHGQRRARTDASTASRSSALRLQIAARTLPADVRGTAATSSSVIVISPICSRSRPVNAAACVVVKPDAGA